MQRLCICTNTMKTQTLLSECCLHKLILLESMIHQMNKKKIDFATNINVSLMHLV